MTSSLIPDVDLVPSVTSRVVTIDVASMIEARPVGELWVDFILPCDLHVAADDKIIKAGSERVTLVNGRGEIRLPCFDRDAKTVDGSEDWVILVRKSWGSEGCRHGRVCSCSGPYAIQVPVGTTNIALADLPAVRELTMRERIWRITGASATVSEGSQWDVSAEVNGSIINFDWTVPPGGTAWARGGLGGVHLDTLVESGSYVRTGGTNVSLGYPIETTNSYTEIRLRRIGTAPMRAIMQVNITTLINGRVRTFQRTETNGVWSAWTETGAINVVLGGVHLDTLVESGDYIRSGGSYRSLGYPIDLAGDVYTKIRVDRIGTAPMRATMTALVITEDSTQQFARRQNSDETWGPWEPIGGSGGGYGGTATTEMESTGRWTSQPAEESYLRSLATHEYVSMFEIGRSVENRPIWALQVGPGEVEYPHQKRAVLFTAGMHGNEPGPREGALQFIRELANPKTITYDKVHMTAVIVPTVNPDRIMDTRNNANNVNLNRDFLDYTQPEAQALRSLMQSPDHDFVAYIDGHNGGYGNAVSTRWGDEDPVATALVKQLGKDLHAQIADRYIQQGMPWRMYGEPGFDGIPGDGTLIDGAFMRFGGQFGVPSVLVEVPRTFRSFPAWQAQITMEAFHEVWEYVSVHREAFKAAKTAAGF